MQLPEIKSKFEELKKKSEDLIEFLNLEKKRKRSSELEKIFSDSEIWNKPKESTKLLKENKIINEYLKIGEKLQFGLDDIETYFQLMEEDPDLITEMAEEVSRFARFVEEVEVKNYLSGENDTNNVFLCIHPGAGGTESQDWAEMLLRMYLRFCERMNFKAKIAELLAGEEAGIKSVTVRIEGDFAYGYLKQEIGVHRLVRISPFDSNSRRHTSFAAVFVYPEVDDSIEIEVNSVDLRIDTYRASGKGGQHVNTTDSAVRITHLPTGTIAQCQNERSQHQNKERAMKILKSKLYNLEIQKKRSEKSKLENEKGDIAWGNQIRSYVLQPYQSIKDHRTNLERGDTQKVLDGDIFNFIIAALKQK